MKISKQAIMRASGWSEKQYKSEYSKFSAKVKNLNRLAGTHYNASNELYYSLKEPENATIKAIQEMSSARKGTTQRMRQVAKDYVENRYSGLMRDNSDIKAQFEKIGTKQLTKTGKMRKYSLRQFNAYTKKYLKKLDKVRKSDPLISSDATMEELDRLASNETESTIYEINDEEYSDIFE